MIDKNTATRIAKNEMYHFFRVMRIGGAILAGGIGIGALIATGFMTMRLGFGIADRGTMPIPVISLLFTLGMVVSMAAVVGFCFMWSYILIRWPVSQKTIMRVLWTSMMILVVAIPGIYLFGISTGAFIEHKHAPHTHAPVVIR